MAWYNKKLEKWFNFYLENPFKTWWKARKYFKRPKISINFFTHPMYNCPYASFKYIGKILDIKSCDVSYKRKYESICFEAAPYIWLCFFKRFGFSINLHTYFRDEFGDIQFLDIYYWEYLLNYLVDKKRLSTAYNVCYGTSRVYLLPDYEKDKYQAMNIPIPVVAGSLTKKGIKQLKKEVFTTA